MGGMFTIIKVRENPSEADLDTWYAHPPGTVASLATQSAMEADGIEL